MEGKTISRKLGQTGTLNYIRKGRFYFLIIVILLVIIWLKKLKNLSYLEKKLCRASSSLEPVYLDQPHFILIMCDHLSSGKNKSLKTDIHRQISQANVLIKSAIALSSGPLIFTIVTNSLKVYEDLLLTMREWPHDFKNRLLVEYRPVWYPEEYKSMLNMYAPCATARLFLTESFQEKDAAIFIDTDFIFMSPPQEIWNEFSYFYSKQVVAMAPWLSNHLKKRKVPMSGQRGLNGGVMLMNFTRMKTFPGGGWIAENMKAYEDYKKIITMADQEILNILFSRYPETIYELSCKFNFARGQCDNGKPRCPITQHVGASIIHGLLMTFHEKNHIFEAIYKSWNDHKLGSPLKSLLSIMKNRLRNAFDDEEKCGKVENIKNVLTLRLERYIESKN